MVYNKGATVWGEGSKGPDYLVRNLPYENQVDRTRNSEIKNMPTDTLLEELERLVKRVEARDEKYYKRMRFPMGHAHPSQFWPICAEAYKVKTFGTFVYYRPSDWFLMWFMSVLMYSAYIGSIRALWPVNYWMQRSYRFWGWNAIIGLWLGWMSRDFLIENRMYGLDENSYEIEKYGPLFPDEIELAAKRKLKYEQEYMRCREGLNNYQELMERIDRPISWWDDKAAPGMSGFWAEQQNSMFLERQRQDQARKLRADRAAGLQPELMMP